MITLREIEVRAPDGRKLLQQIDLEIARGEHVALLGPSGAGKSTLLRTINGLAVPSRGSAHVDGVAVSRDETALRRRIGWVIQDVGLFPHLDVFDNVAFVPRLLDWSAHDVNARVDDVLRQVGLAPDRFRRRGVRTLSGGERQRVGVARALAARPTAMLLDEPFAALDPLTRATLQRDVRALLAGVTTLLVTHDVVEALTMADRIVLLEEGQIVVDAKREQFLGSEHPLARRYAQAARAQAETIGACL